MGGNLQKIGRTMEQTGKNLTKKFTVPIMTGMMTTAKMAGDFQYRFAKVASIVTANGDKSAGSMTKFQKQIKSAANETGIAADQYSELVYQAISANVSAAKSVKAVSDAHKLAVAGFTSDSSALNILTTVTNAYGKSAGSMAHISDVLIQTQNRGKTTVDQLAATMGKVIPTAKSLGVSFEDLGAQYSLLTQRGISTRVATTYMNSMLNELGKGGTNVSKVLKSETGKSFSELTKEGKSVGDVLGILKKHCDETGDSFHDLWGNVNSSKAAETLVDGAKSYNQYLDEMKKANGTTQEAFNQIADTFPAKVKKFKGTLRNLGISLGEIGLETLGPIIQNITKCLQKLTVRIDKMSPKTKKAIGKILLMVAAIGPLITVIGKLVGMSGSLAKFIGILGGMGKMSANPFGFLATGTSLIEKFSGAIGGLTSGGGALAALGGAAPVIAGVAVAGGVVAKQAIDYHQDSKKVQQAYDNLVKVKKGKPTKAQLQAAQDYYDNQQMAFAKVWGHAFEVDMTVKTKNPKELKTAKNADKKTLKKQAKEYQKNYDKTYTKVYKDASAKASVAAEKERERQIENGKKPNNDQLTKYYTDYRDNLVKNNKTLQNAETMKNQARKNNPGTAKFDKFGENIDNFSKKWFGDVDSEGNNIAPTGWAELGGKMSKQMQDMRTTWSQGWQQMKQDASTSWQGIGQSLSTHWQNLKTNTVNTFSGMGQSIQGAFSNAGQWVIGKAQAIGTGMSTAWTNAKTATSNAFANIRTSMSEKMASAQQIVSEKLTTIRGFFSSKLSSAGAAVSGAMQSVRAAFSRALGAIHTFVSNQLQKIRNLFAHPITATVNVVQSIKQKITGGGGKGGKGGGKKGKGKAKGGFTQGLTIAGEDPHYPVEAVISFNPSVRKQNIAYWQKAGQMLGVYQKQNADAADVSASVVSASEKVPPYSVNRLGDITEDNFAQLGLAETPVPPQIYESSEQMRGIVDRYAEYNQPNRLGDYEYDDFARLGLEPEPQRYTATVGYLLSSGVNPFEQSIDLLTSSARNRNAFPLQESTGTVSQPIEVGGVTFAPVINVPQGSKVSAEDIVNMLRGYAPEFIDFVTEQLEARSNGRYVTS